MTKDEQAKRQERSERLQVYKLSDQEYFVESSKGLISYKVMLNNGHKSCTCGDFAANFQKDENFMCKHLLAVKNANGNMHGLEKVKKPKLDDRFITNIKGKDFVMYAGVLDLAHQIGLDSMEVEVMQYPTKDNGFEAICKAITYASSGQLFIDFGDANPNNVNKMVVTHLLRVAATRAKARTLRDLTNVGYTCLEEIDADEMEIDLQSSKKNGSKSSQSKASGKKKTDSKPAAKEAEPSKKEQPEKQAEPHQAEPSKPEQQKEQKSGGNGAQRASSAQLAAIMNLGSRRGLSEEDVNRLAQEKLEIPVQEITSDLAGKFIKMLQQAA